MNPLNKRLVDIINLNCYTKGGHWEHAFESNFNESEFEDIPDMQDAELEFFEQLNNVKDKNGSVLYVLGIHTNDCSLLYGAFQMGIRQAILDIVGITCRDSRVIARVPGQPRPNTTSRSVVHNYINDAVLAGFNYTSIRDHMRKYVHKSDADVMWDSYFAHVKKMLEVRQ